MLKKILYTALFAVMAAIPARAQGTRASDTILVLPFANKSGRAEFNWVGESFADSLVGLIDNRGLGVISNQERKAIQNELKIPLTSLPSIATSLKIAQRAKATLLVIGEYQITPESTEGISNVVVDARVIGVNGSVLTENFSDGKRDGFNISEPLLDLQKVQGKLAWGILFRIDKVLYKLDAFPYSENSLVLESESKVPSRAFEAYIKGLSSRPSEARENYFKNAIRLYGEAKPGETYVEAALELGHYYLNSGQKQQAVEYFGLVIQAVTKCQEEFKQSPKFRECKSENYAEAAFYASLIHWQQNNFELAQMILQPLAETSKMVSISNTLGAIKIQAFRKEKKNEPNGARLLVDAIQFFKKSIDSSPDDTDVGFNYCFALFLSKNYLEASEQLKIYITKNQTDGEAYFLVSKALEQLNNKDGAAFADNQARRFLTAKDRYAKLQLEWQKSQTVDLISPRVKEPSRSDFISVVLSAKQVLPVNQRTDDTQFKLDEAESLYKAGRDDEALEALRKLLTSEPMTARAYYLRGMIYLRRPSLDEAISNLRTAVFWNPSMIEGHIALVKVFLQKGDCLQAKNFLASAAQINADNQEVLGLQRQVEKCSK